MSDATPEIVNPEPGSLKPNGKYHFTGDARLADIPDGSIIRCDGELRIEAPVTGKAQQIEVADALFAVDTLCADHIIAKTIMARRISCPDTQATDGDIIICTSDAHTHLVALQGRIICADKLVAQLVFAREILAMEIQCNHATASDGPIKIAGTVHEGSHLRALRADIEAATVRNGALLSAHQGFVIVTDLESGGMIKAKKGASIATAYKGSYCETEGDEVRCNLHKGAIIIRSDRIDYDHPADLTKTTRHRSPAITSVHGHLR